MRDVAGMVQVRALGDQLFDALEEGIFGAGGGPGGRGVLVTRGERARVGLRQHGQAPRTRRGEVVRKQVHKPMARAAEELGVVSVVCVHCRFRHPASCALSLSDWQT